MDTKTLARAILDKVEFIGNDLAALEQRTADIETNTSRTLSIFDLSKMCASLRQIEKRLTTIERKLTKQLGNTPLTS